MHVNPQYPHNPYFYGGREKLSVIIELNEFRSLTFDDSDPSHFLNVLRSQFKDSVGLLKGSSKGDSIGYYIEIAFNNLVQQKQALQKQFIVQNQEMRV